MNTTQPTLIVRLLAATLVAVTIIGFSTLAMHTPIQTLNPVTLKRIHTAWFEIHFFLLTAVCLAGIFWLIAEGSTILPSAIDADARKAQLVATWCLGKEARASNPLRKSIATYLHAAGIQAGYSF